MKAVRTRIHETEVLIEATDEKIEILGEIGSGRATKPTGVTDELLGAYESAKTLIGDIASDMGKRIRELADDTRPSKTALEFSLGFSAEAGVWVVTGKANVGMKVTMTWE